MADNGLWTGLERATGNMANTALNLAQLQNQSRHMRALEDDSKQRLAYEGQRVQMTQEQNDIENRAKKIELDKMEDAQRLIPFNETLSKIGITRPAEQKIFMEYAGPYIETGGASGAPMIQKQHALKLWKEFNSDYNAGIQLGTVRAKEINNEIGALSEQLKQVKKPEEAQGIQKQIDSLLEDRTRADNAVKMFQQKIRATNKDKYQNVQLPNGKWAAVDTATGDKVELPGTPSDVVKRDMQDEAADRRAAKSGSLSKDTKEVNNAVAKLDKYLSFYERQIKAGNAVDYNNKQIEIVQDTKAKLLDGTISPKEIKWSGNKQELQAPMKLDEKTAAAILKEAGGNKDKARKIAKDKGYSF